MRVGIDLDGVCYDFAASLREYLDRCGHPYTYAEPTRWTFYEDWGLSTAQFINLCDRAVAAGVLFQWGDPHDNVAEAFRWIKAAGHTIHIVTDRSFGWPGDSQAATLQWLHLHGLEFDSITFASDKTIAAVDVMVDDKPENYEALCAAGVKAYLLTRPWNQHVKGARRALDLLHFAEVIA